MLLGTAIHSNPDALDALLSHPHSSEAGTVPVLIVLAALRDSEQADITLRKRIVFLLSQLCQNADQLRVFVHSEGLTTLFDSFEPEKAIWDDSSHKFRAKAANFIYDRILSILGSADGLVSQPGSEISGLKDDQTLVKGLKPWCNAFRDVLRKYKVASMNGEDLSPAADAAYESIKEANQKLRAETVHLGICADESEL